jgi:hypothetical protein
MFAKGTVILVIAGMAFNMILNFSRELSRRRKIRYVFNKVFQNYFKMLKYFTERIDLEVLVFQYQRIEKVRKVWGSKSQVWMKDG